MPRGKSLGTGYIGSNRGTSSDAFKAVPILRQTRRSGGKVGQGLPLGYFPNDARPGDTALAAGEPTGKSS